MKFKYEPYEFEKLNSETLDGKRYYKTPDGKKYPSVTTVLSSLSKDSIQKWRNRVGEEEANKISTTAAKRGTKVHTLCENYIFPHLKNENFDADMFDHEDINVKSAFKKIKFVLDKNVSTVHNLEFPLYSNNLKTAGTCDLFCKYNDIPTIVDFKTSLKAKKEEWIKSYFYQATAYALMVYELKGIVIPQIAIIIAADPLDRAQVFLKKTKHYLHETLDIFGKFHEASNL